MKKDLNVLGDPREKLMNMLELLQNLKAHQGTTDVCLSLP